MFRCGLSSGWPGLDDDFASEDGTDILFTDTFADADGVPLASHTPDLGAFSWVSASGTWQVNTNSARIASNNADSYAYVDFGLADGTLNAKVAALAALSGSNLIRLIYRRSASNNFWIVTSQNASGQIGNHLSIWKNVGGSYTNLAYAPHTWQVGQVLSVVMSGESVSVQVDGATVLAVQSAFNATATQHGISADATAHRWDDVTFSTNREHTPFVLPAYLLPVFKESAAKIMRILASSDGLSFPSQPIALDRGTQEVGDFSMIYKDGLYRVVCSNTRVFASNTTNIGYFTSPDLIQWTVSSIDLSATPSAYHIGAPTWFVEPSTGLPYIVFQNVNSGGTTGRFCETHLGAPGDYGSWTTPTNIDMGDIGIFVIDAFVIKEGSDYLLFYKDDSDDYNEYAVASSLLGPYTATGVNDWAGWGSGFEGVALVNPTGSTWWAYLEKFSNNTGYYRSVSTNGRATWSAPIKLTNEPFTPTRGGEVLKIN